MTYLLNFVGLILFIGASVYILLHFVDIVQTKINGKASFRYFVFTTFRYVVATIILYIGIKLLM